MKVLLYFLGETDRASIRYSLYGRFSQSGFLFVVDRELIRFGTSGGEVFRRMGPLDPSRCEDLELLLLTVSSDEAEKLLATCEACARVRIPFNLTDLILFYASIFRDLKERSLFDSPTLNHAQSVILILRECLETDNVLRVVVTGLHSRATLPDTLYQHLLPYTRPLLVSSVTGSCDD